VLRAGLSTAATVYEREPDGRLVYRGVRPGEGWVGHGTFPRKRWTLVGGRLRRLIVHKQRWLSPDATRTCHARPPDDLASVWFCSLVVFVSLWKWLEGEAGVHTHEPVFADLAERPSSRTVQRWLDRALVLAEETALACRRAVIERSEPRPMESLIGGGRAPPADRRRWADPSRVSTLRSGLSLLIEGANALKLPVSLLLAEARGRQLTKQAWMI